MTWSGIKLLTPAVLSMALIATPPVIPAFAAGGGGGGGGGGDPSPSAMSPAPALETLCSALELSSFERKVLLMCAGVEMDSSLTALYARAATRQSSS